MLWPTNPASATRVHSSNNILHSHFLILSFLYSATRSDKEENVVYVAQPVAPWCMVCCIVSGVKIIYYTWKWFGANSGALGTQV